MLTDLCLAHLVRRDWLTDGPLNELLALYIEALQNRRYICWTCSPQRMGRQRHRPALQPSLSASTIICATPVVWRR